MSEERIKVTISAEAKIEYSQDVMMLKKDFEEYARIVNDDGMEIREADKKINRLASSYLNFNDICDWGELEDIRIEKTNKGGPEMNRNQPHTSIVQQPSVRKGLCDVMLLGVLRMPREMRERDCLSRVQFDSRVVEAADELESRTKRIEKLEADIREMIQKAADNSLEGYRELGRTAARAENERDEARARLAELDTALRLMVETFGWSHTPNTYRHDGIKALLEAFSALGLRDGATAEELWPK